MKPHTCATLTPESPGAEYTYGTWSSARVRPGKSRAKKSATQVRLGALPTWTGWRVKFRLNAGFRSLQIAIGLRRDRVSSPGSVL